VQHFLFLPRDMTQYDATIFALRVLDHGSYGRFLSIIPFFYQLLVVVCWFLFFSFPCAIQPKLHEERFHDQEPTSIFCSTDHRRLWDTLGRREDKMLDFLFLQLTVARETILCSYFISYMPRLFGDDVLSCG
jgi:hypothetical protein